MATKAKKGKKEKKESYPPTVEEAVAHLEAGGSIGLVDFDLKSHIEGQQEEDETSEEEQEMHQLLLVLLI